MKKYSKSDMVLSSIKILDWCYEIRKYMDSKSDRQFRRIKEKKGRDKIDYR